MNRILALSIILTTAAAQCLAADTSWTPDSATIQKLEVAAAKADWGPQSHHQPAASIDTYARFYAGTIEGGHHIVRGVFTSRSLRPAKGVHIVSTMGQLPMIMDGGCNVVDVNYDADSDQIIYIRCHGFG